jgi:hypothetical protein
LADTGRSRYTGSPGTAWAPVSPKGSGDAPARTTDRRHDPEPLPEPHTWSRPSCGILEGLSGRPKGKGQGIVFTQSVVTAVTRERTKQRSRARALTYGRPYRHKPGQGQRQGPAPIGGGVPPPRNLIVEAARHPWLARPRPPAHLRQHGKDQPASEPGPPARNPGPGSRNRATESGQSQEHLSDEPDINPYTGTKQTHNSNKPSFRIIDVTSLYRHFHGTAQGSSNHLTNVALRRHGGTGTGAAQFTALLP